MKLKISQMALFIVLILSLLTLARCSRRIDSAVSTPAVAKTSKLQCVQRGIASWYGTHLKGHPTASGEKYDPKALTAASRKFALGTKLSVINLKNNQDVTVTVNDRGPYVGKRVIDMSIAAAHELGMEKDGLAHVCVQNMEQADARADSDTP